MFPGMLETITNAKTLREIQVEGNRGVTGPFKETPIFEYLEKFNASQFEFAKAVNNFTRSCAGYSVITYILGKIFEEISFIKTVLKRFFCHIKFLKIF